ncbi:MAG: hypothetical protein OFPII_08620 [Osedax symbiont Rs1]|nr:MAG: hypothetical protein OFPII_08620 [Osedax symbiont Rs1]
MSKIGRNDLCPCDSGKKYKKCCANIFSPQQPGQNLAREANQKLVQAMAGQQFQSEEDMQIFLDHKVRQLNDAPQAELGGFSPTQVHTLLYAPTAEQTMIKWRPQHRERVNGELETAAIITLFKAFKSFALESKIKATAAGKLPTALVKHAQIQLQDHLDRNSFFTIQRTFKKEDDFRELHKAKIIFELAGLLRCQKGYFLLTKKALQINDDDLFQLLFSTYFEEFNWGYEDNYPEAALFQQMVWYSLVKLQRLGDNKVCCVNFSKELISTFAEVAEEFEDSLYSTRQSSAVAAYHTRMLERFWLFFGLVEIRGKYDARTMQSTPLLNKLWDFP